MDFKRLKWLLFFSFLFLTILPLVTLGHRVMVNGEAAVHERAAVHLQNIAEKSALVVQSFLAERFNDIRLLAATVSTGDTTRHPNWREERLEMVKQQYGVYHDLLLVDSKGKPLSLVQGEHFPPIHFDGETWFREAIAGREYLGDAILNEDRQEPLLHLSVPVKGGTSGSPNAVLLAEIDLESIEKQLSKVIIEQTGEIYLVDGRGRFLTNTRFGIKPLLQKIDLIAYHETCSEGATCRRTDYRGVSVLSAGFVLPKTGWTVIVDQDWEEISRKLFDIKKRLLFLGLLLVAIEMVVAYAISSQIARMLERSYKHGRELELQVLQQEKLISMGLLTAGMAHELNTPIANALVYSQLLIEELSPQPEEAHRLEMLKTVEEEIQQVSRIVRNLLEFSRRPQTNDEHTDVNALLHRLLDIANIKETHPDVQITSDFQKNLPLAHADSSILKQVFGNLVSNALDAMPDGGTLRITTRFVKALRKINVDVSDTGNGIPAEEIDKVFQPFFTTKLKKEGMGLGLFVGYGMIRRLGGTIRVISTHRKDALDGSQSCGTTFTVELPVSDLNPDLPRIQDNEEEKV